MNKPNLYQSVETFVTDLQKAGGKPLYELSPMEARRVLLKVQSGKTDMPDAKTEEIFVSTGSDSGMRVLIVRPRHISKPLPAIFYIHGGGWVMGNEVTHERLIRQLANDVSAAIVFPIYTPSPESQYPKTTNDLFSVLKYIAEHGESYNIDTHQLAVAGDSVGGNMAAVMTLMAKKNGNNPHIDFQLLLYPVTNAEFNTDSYEKYADGPWLTKKAMEWFWQQYAPDKKARKEIYASPLQATVEDLEDLPPALVVTDENDVLRDEGEAYAQKLNDAGVTVGAIRVNGTIHDFLMLNALAETEPTREAYGAIVRTLQDALGLPHCDN